MLTPVTAISSRKEECAMSMQSNASRYLRWLSGILLTAAIRGLLVRMVNDLTQRR